MKKPYPSILLAPSDTQAKRMIQNKDPGVFGKPKAIVSYSRNALGIASCTSGLPQGCNKSRKEEFGKFRKAS